MFYIPVHLPYQGIGLVDAWEVERQATQVVYPHSQFVGRTVQNCYQSSLDEAVGHHVYILLCSEVWVLELYLLIKYLYIE